MKPKPVISKKRAKPRIIFPAVNQSFAVEEMHDRGINIKDFSIYLTGTPIYYESGEDFEEPGVEYQMATQFIKNLHILTGKNAKRPILVHMKTCGGIWEEGMAIYDAILACPNPVAILSYTHARSMSSIILQAADKRVLMPHSYFLFHEGTVSVYGSQKGFLSFADWYKKIATPTMLDIYAGRLKRKGKYNKWSLGRIKDTLKRYMDRKEDVYLTAQEAVEWGFADEIFGGGGQFNWESLRKF